VNSTATRQQYLICLQVGFLLSIKVVFELLRKYTINAQKYRLNAHFNIKYTLFCKIVFLIADIQQLVLLAVYKYKFYMIVYSTIYVCYNTIIIPIQKEKL
jgi:hypothetical protein